LRLTKLAPLLAVLTLAACQTPEVAPTIVASPQSTGYARGIDMPTDSSDVLSELQGRRWLDFVARYYRDPSSRWPPLTASEARRLAALGVKIVTVWEWHSHDPAYFSYATGYNDALNASRQAKGVGQPPGSAIYFAVDFNARGSQLDSVDQYFRGVNAGLAAAGGGRPEYKIGVYGSGAVCAAMRGAGLAHYAWLSGSTAWEGTAGYNDWNIKQAAQGGRFGNLSFNHDANEAWNDYGGFQLGNYASAATPAAVVVMAAAVAPAAAATLVNDAVTSIIPPPAPATPPPPASPIASVAPVAPPAPAAAPVQAAAPPAPISAAPAMAQMVPAAPTAPAAEVAALVAAEPQVAVAAVPRMVVEPEEPRPARRSSKPSATSAKPPRERNAARAAKGSQASKPKVYAAASSRALAIPPRHAVGSAPGGSHEPAHKASVSSRSGDHAAHPQPGKAAAAHRSDRPARQHTEQRQP
jgi:hypothetical protein